MSDFKTGDLVTFKPGPNSSGPVTAKVTSTDGGFLVTKDVATDKERKVRPGACKKAA